MPERRNDRNDQGRSMAQCRALRSLSLMTTFLNSMSGEHQTTLTLFPACQSGFIFITKSHIHGIIDIFPAIPARNHSSDG
jgi:hypothetical protein